MSKIRKIMTKKKNNVLFSDKEDLSHLNSYERGVVEEVAMTANIASALHMELLDSWTDEENPLEVSSPELFKIAAVIRTNMILARGLHTEDLKNSPAFLEAIAMQLGQTPKL